MFSKCKPSHDVLQLMFFLSFLFIDKELFVNLLSQFDHNFISSKLFHVRSVTQGDVIRADAKDIPKIFQVEAIELVFCRKLLLYLVKLSSKYFVA